MSIHFTRNFISFEGVSILLEDSVSIRFERRQH